MKERLLSVLGFLLGVGIYYYAKIREVNPEILFNIVSIILLCCGLLKIDSLLASKSENLKTRVIIGAVIGVIFIFMVTQ